MNSSGSPRRGIPSRGSPHHSIALWRRQARPGLPALPVTRSPCGIQGGPRRPGEDRWRSGSRPFRQSMRSGLPAQETSWQDPRRMGDAKVRSRPGKRLARRRIPRGRHRTEPTGERSGAVGKAVGRGRFLRSGRGQSPVNGGASRTPRRRRPSQGIPKWRGGNGVPPTRRSAGDPVSQRRFLPEERWR